MITKRGTIERFFPTTDGRVMRFVITVGNMFGDKDKRTPDVRPPRHWCLGCQDYHDIYDFINCIHKEVLVDKHGNEREYQILSDGNGHMRCYRHFSPVVIEVPEPGGKWYLRIGTLRDARGWDESMFDRKEGSWIAVRRWGIRKMSDKDELRYQPFKDRSWEPKKAKQTKDPT